jgi:mono/diheme cytochrome c family protein
MKLTGLYILIGLFAVQSGTRALAAEASGKAIYDKSCVGCHGADGKGNLAIAKTLGEKGLNLTSPEATKKSDAELLKIITDGAGKMPALKSLSSEDRKQVLTYVRSLTK